MLISEMYSVIVAYITWAINNPEVRVTQAYQSTNPSPLSKFITVNIGAFKNTGTPHLLDIDDEGMQKIGISQTFNVTINAFTDTLHLSEELLNDVKDKLQTSSADRMFFHDKFAYTKTLMGVSALPVDTGAKYESRAILELEFNRIRFIQDEVGIIETVVIENEMDGSTIIVN